MVILAYHKADIFITSSPNQNPSRPSLLHAHIKLLFKGISEWVNLPPLSYRHQSRHILASFFRSLENVDPWWVSIDCPVNGDHSTKLSSVLGYEHEVGLEFLVGTGLIIRRHEQNPSYSVVKKEWEMLIVAHGLQDIMEGINRTRVDAVNTLFIYYGNKAKLRHIPSDQFDTKKPWIKKRQLYNIDLQQKFHPHVTKVVVAARMYEKSLDDEMMTEDDGSDHAPWMNCPF